MVKKGSGWHGEPRRHALAGKGVKTTYKTRTGKTVVMALAGGQPVLMDVDKWPDTFYRGHNLFNIYMEATNKFYDELELGTSWTEKVYDEEEDYHYDEEVRRDGQESYLGYIPSQDTFVSGWDMWEGEENPAGLVWFKIDDAGMVTIVKKEIDHGSRMMYGKSGARKKLLEKHPDMIEVRLD